MNLEQITQVITNTAGLPISTYQANFESPCVLIALEYHPPAAGTMSYNIYDTNDPGNIGLFNQISSAVIPSTGSSIFKTFGSSPFMMKNGVYVTMSAADTQAKVILSFLPRYPRNYQNESLKSLFGINERLDKMLKMLSYKNEFIDSMPK